VTLPRGRALVAGLLGTVVLLAGCPSAYQRTYDQRMQQLESQQRADTAAAEAAHAQAQKYAAVVYFAVGSAAIDADGQREISWFVQQMQPYPQAIIDVQGFADDTGGAKTNVQLSQQRADNVAAALNAQGIAAPRIAPQGFGDQYPAASNVSARGRRNNRRVEVTVR
jgi:outer membrane protein OmpA-like peptidoglycan-associated protein